MSRTVMYIIFALGSAILTAVIGTLTKAGLSKVDPYFAIAVQATILTILAWIIVASQKKINFASLAEDRAWIYMLGAGVTMMGGYACYFLALKGGKSSVAQPIDRLSLVFAIVMAGLFLKEKMSWATFVGGVLMAAGALVLALGSPKGS